MKQTEIEKLLDGMKDATEIATNVQSTIFDMIGRPSTVALAQYYFIAEIINSSAKANMKDCMQPDEIKWIKKMVKGFIKNNNKRKKYYPN
jgi:hypothetical protein|tara:strand:- start:44 stop:313 length:270 start_codon:yes stop_codon:yes gene_type:complete